jgi:hypothetical protein
MYNGKMKMQDDTLVYIWSVEHDAYWSPNCRGYTSVRGLAGAYPLKQAIEICQGANVGLYESATPKETIQPIPASDVIELGRKCVLR